MTTNPKCRAAGGSCNCSNADAVSCPDQHATAPAMTAMTEQEQIRVLRNELAIIIGCDDGRSAQEKAGAVIAWIDKHDQRVSIQPVAAPEPDAWMHNNLKECTTAASKRKMENAGFGVWAEVAASYTTPLYTAAPAQAWTALTPEELVMANEAIRQMAHGFMPNTVDLFRRLVAAAPAQAAPDEVLEQIAESWDGCMYDSVGEMLDIGERLRIQFRALRTTSANDLPAGWDTACIPYGGDGNTRLEKLIDATTTTTQAATPADKGEQK